MDMKNLFETDQSSLRDRLARIIRTSPDTIQAYAKAIGIANFTLVDFLKGNRKHEFKTLVKIENYILAWENQNKSLD